jgi:hypothetical protein
MVPKPEIPEVLHHSQGPKGIVASSLPSREGPNGRLSWGYRTEEQAVQSSFSRAAGLHTMEEEPSQRGRNIGVLEPREGGGCGGRGRQHTNSVVCSAVECEELKSAMDSAFWDRVLFPKTPDDWEPTQPNPTQNRIRGATRFYFGQP